MVPVVQVEQPDPAEWVAEDQVAQVAQVVQVEQQVLVAQVGVEDQPVRPAQVEQAVQEAEEEAAAEQAAAFLRVNTFSAVAVGRRIMSKYQFMHQVEVVVVAPVSLQEVAVREVVQVLVVLVQQQPEDQEVEEYVEVAQVVKVEI